MYLLKPIAYILQTAIELRVLSERRWLGELCGHKTTAMEKLEDISARHDKRLHVSAHARGNILQLTSEIVVPHPFAAQRSAMCLFSQRICGRMRLLVSICGLTRAEVCDAEAPGDCFGISFSLTAMPRGSNELPQTWSACLAVESRRVQMCQQTFTSTQMYMIESWLPVYLDEHSGSLWGFQ